MIKIEMLPHMDPLSSTGVSHNEYIWLGGQNMPWPVPESDNDHVGKVECFGGELSYLQNIPGGIVKDADGNIMPAYRCWYTKEAVFVSTEMRKIAGSSS